MSQKSNVALGISILIVVVWFYCQKNYGKVSFPEVPSVCGTQNTTMIGETVAADTVIEDDGLSEMERRMIEQTNLERQSRGLPLLQVDARLMESARDHVVKMATNRQLRHGNSGFAGEIIAYGRMSPEECTQGWLRSPGHRRILLGPSYSTIGVGVARASNGGIYWVERFGSGLQTPPPQVRSTPPATPVNRPLRNLLHRFRARLQVDRPRPLITFSETMGAAHDLVSSATNDVQEIRECIVQVIRYAKRMFMVIVALLVLNLFYLSFRNLFIRKI